VRSRSRLRHKVQIATLTHKNNFRQYKISIV
jgi:hypothetical protein